MADEGLNWGSIVCPVCRRAAYHTAAPDPHLNHCPIGQLESRVTDLESLCKRLSGMVSQLDDRTIGMAKFGGSRG